MEGNLVHSMFPTLITGLVQPGSFRTLQHPASNLEQGWEWDSLVCPLVNSTSWGGPRDTLLSIISKLQMVKMQNCHSMPYSAGWCISDRISLKLFVSAAKWQTAF